MIKELLKKIYYKWAEKRQRELYVVDESRNMYNVELVNLTNQEKQEVYDLWYPVVPKKFFLYHKMYKTFSHFDARFVSDEYYYPVLLRSLNPKDTSSAFERKSLYPILYKDIPQPKFYVNKYNGVYYDCDFNAMEEQQAISILEHLDSFIIKPTHDSVQGKNVRLIKPSVDNVKQAIEGYGKDFIVQEVLEQSEMTARFNSSSLNTFRITTLNINGICSLCSIVFRCGNGDGVVDNLGAGGIMIGVTEDGQIHDYGFDKKYNKHYSSNNRQVFKGTVIPQMKGMVELAKRWHEKYLLHSGIVGFDIAMNKNNEPVMIEVNLMYPGIQTEQLCTGPLFGERTKEVIDYCSKNKKN